jgi:hypothetical protein
VRGAIISTLAALIAAAALAGCGGGSKSGSASSGSAASNSSGSSTATAGAGTPTTGTGTGSSSPYALSFEGIPLETGPSIAPADTTQLAPVDGIKCEPVEQLVYHIHAHLAVFLDGKPYALPGGIGIPGSATEQTTEGPVAAGGRCFYWLHTHTSDGVIHIESPTDRIYTLGNFFDEWHQPLTATRVGNVRGRMTVFVNGRPWKQSARQIPLLPHTEIQLDVGTPKPAPVRISWAGTGL